MRSQLFPRVRIFAALTEVEGPNGPIDHRGYSIAIWWFGLSAGFTFARQVKP